MNKIVIRSGWRDRRQWVGFGGVDQFRIRCGEGQEGWPDGHENEWKSATDRVEEVRGISKT